jgi:regulator of sigma E protease
LDQPPTPQHPDPLKADPAGTTRGADDHRDAPLPNSVRPPEANGQHAPPEDEGVEEAPPPPLTPVGWLVNNGVWLLVLAAIIALVVRKLGWEGLWQGGLVIFGIGFVIFIHELGHFLTAKWCDVHVQTFSIGFGPALPGCSFRRGETTYKIGILPLGGYVNMVGEGPEADEDENYPRSFKNKTVGQRMIIISAGVIMNVLFGCLVYIFVYMTHGMDRQVAVVGIVDAGGPLWDKGIPSGSAITRIGDLQNPFFDDLRIKVVLSRHGEVIPFTFVLPDGTVRTVDLLPRREENDPNPIIGVTPAQQLRLPPEPPRASGSTGPVVPGSAAAAARPLQLLPEEVVVAATDPDHPDQMLPVKHDLARHTFDYQDLARRMKRLVGQKMVVRVQSGDGEPEDRELPTEGFRYDDTIVGCTDWPQKHESNPFLVTDLPPDPRNLGDDHRDPVVFHDRLVRLAGQPMVIAVHRHHAPAGAAPVHLFVPPAYHVTFGMRMKMGKVAALREDSPAAQAGVHKGDELRKVAMIDAQGKKLLELEDLDPERLPFQLARKAASVQGTKKVVLTVRRPPAPPEHTEVDVTLPAVEWEDSWSTDDEQPFSPGAPLPIRQLGLAYWVMSQVVEVGSDSPAAQASRQPDDSAPGLRAGDQIDEIRFKQQPRNGEPADWGDWRKLSSEREGKTVYDRWASTFWGLQEDNRRSVQVHISRPGEEVKEPFEMTAREDTDWPLTSRGLLLLSDYRVEKAENFGQALVMGAHHTGRLIVLMYLQLRSLATGRVSYKQMGGPIMMVSQGYMFAEGGWYGLLLFLAAISINLAVVNFLPIPVLDGGHMVFLIYEKLRGRPPSERVRVIATYIGLAVILSLMVFVFYQDFHRYLLGPIKRMLGM